MSSFSQNPLYLQDLYVKNFRNIDHLKLSFEPGHYLLVGKNGQGKTNCLEAISLACSLKPMQALSNSDLIKNSETEALIEANFYGRPHLAIEIFPEGKKVRLNRQALKNAFQFTKDLSSVSFIPAELGMITGSTSLRRRALDQAASALFFEHVIALRSYGKLLNHRNRLLKNWPIDREMVATFTEMLIKEAAQIIFARLKTIEKMQAIFSEKVCTILGKYQPSTINYVVEDRIIANHTLPDLIALLSQKYALLENLEYKRKVTLFGPHLDDMLFILDGKNAKNAASRGQSRAIVLAFKLAQMLAIQEIRGCAPIIILDDIVSELDTDNKSNLIKTIADLNAQAFFATVDKTTFGGHIEDDHIFLVDDGYVSGI
jgi:DNA replication and repair protein RecF